MGWLLPLGSHKVMGLFAGYSVSVSAFEIVLHFFNIFFLRLLEFDGLLFGRRLFFHARGPRRIRLAYVVQLFL